MKSIEMAQPLQDGKLSQSKSRVLIIGLDGGTFDVIKPLIAQGRLSNLARLMDSGSYGILRSTFPPITPTAWTSFATGKNPGQHGFYDFQKIDPETYEFSPIPAGQHGHKSVWKLVSEHGGQVVVLDVPFTYPPEQVNGYVLTGYGTPEVEGVRFTHPPELQAELAKVCGSCELGYPVGKKFSSRPEFLQLWDKAIENRSCISTYLMDKIDWDFYVIVYGVTDNLAHALWPFLEPQHPAYYEENSAHHRQKFFEYYEKIDQQIGELLARRDDQTTTLVMSDHGFGSTPNPKYLTKLLIDAGLLRYKSNPVSDSLTKIALHAYYGVPLFSKLVRKLSGAQRMALKKTLTATAIFPTPDTIDWEKTKAFPGGYGLQIYINTEGKYPQGTVSPGTDYEAMQTEIIQRLLSFRDPDSGQPVVKAVHRAQDIYSGTTIDGAPDLLIEYNNVYSPETKAHQGILNNRLEGNHVMEGIFIAQGANIVSTNLPTLDIIDIAPTVLYLLGLPVPQDMDGRVITQIMDPTYMKQHPIQYSEPAVATPVNQQDYTEEEAELVREQLRALGYID